MRLRNHAEAAINHRSFIDPEHIRSADLTNLQIFPVVSIRSDHGGGERSGYTVVADCLAAQRGRSLWAHLISLRKTPVTSPNQLMRLRRSWRGISLSVFSAGCVFSCGYVGLDTNDDLGFDIVATGGVTSTGGVASTGGSDTRSGGGPSTGGVSPDGGMPGMGGEPSWGGFGGLGGYGGSGGDCEWGESCDFFCIQSPCRVDCPALTTCEIETEDASQVVTRCRQGSSCKITGAKVPSLALLCQGPGDCDLSCNGAEVCAAQCTGPGECLLECGGSNCSVQCGNASHCTMIGGAADRHTCAGTKLFCADGVTTCNQPCP